MKNVLIICILLVFTPSITCKSSAFELQKHKEILKTQTSACSASNYIKVDSIANYTISINGKQNLVTIKIDSLTVQTDKSITKKSKDSNSIEINGESNSVSVNQKSRGKVVVKQSGKINHINITQSSHKP